MADKNAKKRATMILDFNTLAFLSNRGKVMKNIALIIGSLRKDSINRQYANAIVAELNKIKVGRAHV